MYGLEMWGGIDYPLNRIGDDFLHRGETNEHNNTHSIQMFIDLGIKKIRTPCLWELSAPKDLDHYQWTALDDQLNECQRLNLIPIAHFLHHGSGPVYTSIIDPDFPEKFATYARSFAKRYPWIEDYSLINDIFLTSRLSCLEETWYPHLNSKLYFLKSILLQCQATVLAMREIRGINPRAKLIQTDELGLSPKAATYKKDLATNYRWLALDLLCGKVNENYELYGHLLRSGLTPEEINWFQENSCSPNIIGINLFDKENHEKVIASTWNRYRIPLALTQVEATNSQDIQYLWNMAKSLKNANLDIRAVTAWTQEGGHNWYQHYTKCEKQYGPQVFSLKSTISSLQS